MIVDDDNELVYTPPDFARNKMINKDQIVKLADKFNELQSRDISAIIEFESLLNKK